MSTEKKYVQHKWQENWMKGFCMPQISFQNIEESVAQRPNPTLEYLPPMSMCHLEVCENKDVTPL